MVRPSAASLSALYPPQPIRAKASRRLRVSAALSRETSVRPEWGECCVPLLRLLMTLERKKQEDRHAGLRPARDDRSCGGGHWVTTKPSWRALRLRSAQAPRTHLPVPPCPHSPRGRQKTTAPAILFAMRTATAVCCFRLRTCACLRHFLAFLTFFFAGFFLLLHPQDPHMTDDLPEKRITPPYTGVGP